MSKPNRLKSLWIRNHGHQQVRHRTPVTETLCQGHWHSKCLRRTKIYNNNKAVFQWAVSVTSKVIKNLNLRENIFHKCEQSKDVNVNHIPGIIKPSDIFTKKIKRKHTLQKSQWLHDGLPPWVSEIQSQNPLTNYILWKNSLLLFHTVGTNSYRQSRTKKRRSRTRHSNHSGNLTGSQTDRIKRSFLHCSWQGGVEGSWVNESWPQHLSIICS